MKVETNIMLLDQKARMELKYLNKLIMHQFMTQFKHNIFRHDRPPILLAAMNTFRHNLFAPIFLTWNRSYEINNSIFLILK